MLARAASLRQLTPAQAKLARAAQRAMLGVERQTLTALQRAADEALGRLLRAVELAPNADRARRALLLATRGVADGLRMTVHAIVTTGRRSARDAARQRLGAELALVAKDLALPAFVTLAASRGDLADQAYAESAAEGFVAAWRASVTLVAVRKSEAPVTRDLRTAVSAQAFRLRRIAATEVPQAYNVEHDEGAGWVAEQHKDARWMPLIVKRWDATFDNTCTTCEEMHGRLVPLWMSFKGGLIPGHVHWHCRCLETIVALPLRMRGEVVPGYEVSDEEPREAA